MKDPLTHFGDSTGTAVLAFYILKTNVKEYIIILGDDPKQR
jgi:hypothetical protein